MKSIFAYIAGHQQKFAHHPFFLDLADSESNSALASIAMDLAFWIMVFQDILRINEQKIRDPFLFLVAIGERC